MMVEFDRGHDNASDIKRSDFPDDFIFGVGSSAYQVMYTYLITNEYFINDYNDHSKELS